MLGTIRKVVDVLSLIQSDKAGLKSLINGNLSMASYKICKNISSIDNNIDSIIDVGANKGQFALNAVSFFPTAKIYSFEPLPDVFPLLSKRVLKYNQIKSYNFALGNQEGEIEFYKNHHSHASSALPISDFQTKEIPETKETTIIKVPIHKLDDCVSQLELGNNVLLKLDVQGFEKEVLRGSITTLKNIKYILLEMSFIPLYNGEPLFDEMYQFLNILGFDILSPVGSLETKDGKILQIDFLFKRKSSE